MSTSKQDNARIDITDMVVKQNNVSVVNGTQRIILQDQLIEIKESVVKKIPYFETLFSDRFPTTKNPDGVIISHDLNPEIVKVIIQCVERNEFEDLFTFLPKNESVVDLFETFHFLCVKLPYTVFTNLISIKNHTNEIFRYVLMPMSLSYFVHQFAYNLIYVKNNEARKEDQDQDQDQDKMFLFTTLYLLLKDVDVKQKHHLQKLSLQILPLTIEQKTLLENIDITKQFNKASITAVLKYQDAKIENFLLLLEEDDNPIEFFDLINYLNLDLFFSTSNVDIISYVSSHESVFQVKTITKLAFLIYLNKEVLTQVTINNIITKARKIICLIKKKDHDNKIINALNHLKTVIKVCCSTVTDVQLQFLQQGIDLIRYRLYNEEKFYDSDGSSDYANYNAYVSDKYKLYSDSSDSDNDMSDSDTDSLEYDD